MSQLPSSAGWRQSRQIQVIPDTIAVETSPKYKTLLKPRVCNKEKKHAKRTQQRALRCTKTSSPRYVQRQPWGTSETGSGSIFACLANKFESDKQPGAHLLTSMEPCLFDIALILHNVAAASSQPARLAMPCHGRVAKDVKDRRALD